MRVLACGSRGWDDRETVFQTLRLFQGRGEVIILHGDARGADRMAGDVATELGFIVEVDPADWNHDGRAAGYRRNARMVARGNDYTVAFWDGLSRGTASTIRLSLAAGTPTLVVPRGRRS